MKKKYRRLSEDMTAEYEAVLNAACEYFDVDPRHFRMRHRPEWITRARHSLIWYLTTQKGWRVTDLAHIMNFNHATIIHARDRLNEIWDDQDDLDREAPLRREHLKDFQEIANQKTKETK
jgi:chromosomal replication initiation ATPase DnaA